MPTGCSARRNGAGSGCCSTARATHPIWVANPVDGAVRTPEVTALVSPVSALPEVREWVNQQLRALAGAGQSVVVDGRDIGTVVFPEAALKVYLTASAATRAERRLRQRGQVVEPAELRRETAALAARDAGRFPPRGRPAPDGARTPSRSTAPAWISTLQVEQIVALARERGMEVGKGCRAPGHTAAPLGLPQPSLGPMFTGSPAGQFRPRRGLHLLPAAGPGAATLRFPVVTTEQRSLSEIHSTATGLKVRADLYDEDYSEDEYEQMLSMYEGTMSQIVEGEIVKSKVLRVTESAVILDVGFKSEGSVPLDEFKDPPAPGDEVEVFLEHLEDQEGAVVLSKKKADFMRVWEKIKLAHESDQPVMGTLVKKIKGGVVVNLMGVDAFLPGSQIALRRVPNIDELLGQSYDFKIIKLNKRRRNIVVSRRVILENERAHKREHLMKELAVGQVRKGVVKNITDFGAFIDLGGVDGLLHITDMSYGRVSHPTEMVGIGREVEVKILDIDWQRERISLGMKQLQPYPWQKVAERYPVGTRVQGKVVSITNYGAFVELEPGIEGLVHISEMSWTRNVRHPSKIVSIGETIEAVVLKVDESEEKISLGMKQTEQDPWTVLPLKYPVATRLDGKVRNLTSLRRLRGDRAGHRRPDPYLRHVLDQAGAAPVGGGQEG